MLKISTFLLSTSRKLLEETSMEITLIINDINNAVDELKYSSSFLHAL